MIIYILTFFTGFWVFSDSEIGVKPYVDEVNSVIVKSPEDAALICYQRFVEKNCGYLYEINIKSMSIEKIEFPVLKLVYPKKEEVK